MCTSRTVALGPPVTNRSIARAIASRLPLVITGVGIGRWYQLVVFGLPTTRVKNP